MLRAFYGADRYPPAGPLVLPAFQLAATEHGEDPYRRDPQRLRGFPRGVVIGLSHHMMFIPLAKVPYPNRVLSVSVLRATVKG